MELMKKGRYFLNGTQMRDYVTQRLEELCMEKHIPFDINKFVIDVSHNSYSTTIPGYNVQLKIDNLFKVTFLQREFIYNYSTRNCRVAFNAWIEVDYVPFFITSSGFHEKPCYKTMHNTNHIEKLFPYVIDGWKYFLDWVNSVRPMINNL